MEMKAKHHAPGHANHTNGSATNGSSSKRHGADNNNDTSPESATPLMTERGTTTSVKSQDCGDCICCCCCMPCGIFSPDTKVPDSKIQFDWYDFPLGIFGLVLFYFDIATDIIVARDYFDDGHVNYGAVSAAIVAVSFAFNYVILVYTLVLPKKWTKLNVLKCAGITILLVPGPLVVPLFTVVQLWYGCKSRQKGLSKEDRRDLLTEMADSFDACVLIRVIEVFMESAPQLLWQLYLLLVTKPLLHDSFDGWMKLVSIGSSLLNLGITQAVAKKLNKNMDKDKKESTMKHLVLDTVWRTVQTAQRVLCVALFASCFGWWFMAVLVPHGILVFIWIYRKVTNFEANLGDVLRVVLNVYISVFSHFNYGLSLGGRSFYWYFILNVLFFVENFAMLLLWYFFTEDQEWWFHTWALVGGLVSLPLYLLLQMGFYRFCHPEKDTIRQDFLGDFCKADTWKKELCERTWKLGWKDDDSDEGDP